MAAVITLIVVLLPFAAWAIWRSPGYKRQLLDQPPSPGWSATCEAFIDPSSREPVQVWVNQASGERAYVRVAGGRRPVSDG